ncbi:3-deoxy-D-manno-octulosonic acid transferase [Zavarzinia sp. CC-PAN008]|uniref:3-deoxy-D-manno-octulosonic acid transferase n=1 Tax=Zavarzinia sp. CC-PAN008 TaxID=3243332 RepID=UPI003F742B0E
MIGAWRTLATLGGPLLSLWLRRRVAQGKEDPARLAERKGIASVPRPAGPVAWFHGASNGEALSLLPLVEHYQAQGVTCLVTTGTLTSARLMARRLPRGAIHQFVPLDRPAWARRFLDHWRPALAVFVESELWPTLLLEAKGRGVRLALLNARMSVRSHRGWQRAPGLARRLLSSFDAVLAQGEGDATRLRDLGAVRVALAPNLKLAASPLPFEAGALDQLTREIGRRPVWLAASTHPGEELRIAAVHQALLPRFPDLLTIVVPRHPGRGDALAAALAEVLGGPVARRARGDALPVPAGLYLADTLGELGLFYRAVRLVLMGGTLVPVGGHNPLEPAILGCAVMAGPYMANFGGTVDLMGEALLRVADDAALQARLAGLLADAGAVAAAGTLARQKAEGAAQGVLDAALAALDPLLAAGPAA